MYAQELLYRFGTTLGQSNVVFTGTALISVTFQTNFRVSVVLQVGRVGTQGFESRSRNGVAVEREVDNARIGSTVVVGRMVVEVVSSQRDAAGVRLNRL